MDPWKPTVFSLSSHRAAFPARCISEGVTVHLAGPAVRQTCVALEGLKSQDNFRGKIEASTCNFHILSCLLHCTDGRVEGEGTHDVAEIHQTQKLH